MTESPHRPMNHAYTNDPLNRLTAAMRNTRANLTGGTPTNGPDNTIGWDGYVFNAATGDYLVRHRTYLPPLGRWGERDPIRARVNLLEAMDGAPLSRVDPSGRVPADVSDGLGLCATQSGARWPDSQCQSQGSSGTSSESEDPRQGCGSRLCIRPWSGATPLHHWIMVPLPRGAARQYDFYPDLPWFPGHWHSAPTGTAPSRWWGPNIAPTSDPARPATATCYPVQLRAGNVATCAAIRACLARSAPWGLYAPGVYDCRHAAADALDFCGLEPLVPEPIREDDPSRGLAPYTPNPFKGAPTAYPPSARPPQNMPLLPGQDDPRRHVVAELD